MGCRALAVAVLSWLLAAELPLLALGHNHGGANMAITSASELNTAIQDGPNRKVGVLSQANFDQVQQLLPSTAEPMIFQDKGQVLAAVLNGTVIAGYVSGQVDPESFSTWSADSIAPRAFQMLPDNRSWDLMMAVDAAVVRAHGQMEVQAASDNNQPFEIVSVRSCSVRNVSEIPFPAAATATGLLQDVLQTRKLRILSSGTPDALPHWGTSGNYEVTPPTGFWPEVMDSFMAHFRAAYGSDIQLERVWMLGDEGREMVLNGTIHMTEPYYVYNAFNLGVLRKWQNRFSCIVMGLQGTFFTKPPQYNVQDDGSGSQTNCITELSSCIAMKVANVIHNTTVLNERIDAGPNKKVGFLSSSNYWSVHTHLSNQIEPTYFGDTHEMEAAVANGTLLAASISGQPNVSRFHVWSSDFIDPRGFQTMHGDQAKDLLRALDAAIMRAYNAGHLSAAATNNPPFKAVQVDTCRVANESQVPFPPAATATGLLREVLDTKKLRMLAYGTDTSIPNWGQDGNYEVNPPTGYWPEVVTAVFNQFKSEYGSDIDLVRVWRTDRAGSEMVRNGSIHVSEPYYIYNNMYTGSDGSQRPKKWSFDVSCYVMGYEPQYFSMKPDTDFSAAGPTCEQQLEACEQHGSSDTTGAERGAIVSLVVLAAVASMGVQFW